MTSVGRASHETSGPAARDTEGRGTARGRSVGVSLWLPLAFWLIGALAVALHAAHSAFGLGGDGPMLFFTTWLAFGAFLLAAATCLARSACTRDERGTWLAVGIGLLVYSFGLLYYNLVFADAPPAGFPSVADLFWLALCPSALAALVLLVRCEAQEVRFDLWLDGLIGGLAMASIGATVLFEVVLSGPLAAPAANLTFALLDLLVVGFAVATWGLFGWRPSRSLLLLTLGFAALAVQDSVYLHQLVQGTLEIGTLLDSWWLAVMLIIASGATLSARPAGGRRASGGQLVVVPFVFALTAVALAAYFHLSSGVNALTAGLNTATLVAVVVRFALTARSHLALLAVSREEALTDALTGLGNRRRLLRDAEGALAEASPEQPVTLAIFDLDGFKTYNDAYGHPAGDALLARLGHKLAQAVEPSGVAYRLGGDEFCVLLSGAQLARRQGLAAATAALTEEGEAFTVCSSYGSVDAPDEAHDTTQALRRADERLYAAKDSRPSAPGRQACEALRQILLESEPELDVHHEVVGRLAHAVGRRLGVDGEQLRDLARAAELHDIGKIAIPDAILHKPGPLTDEEWRFMRRHTTIGERFLASIPALMPAARLVRSSHERLDGNGYPDGLAGEQIPLGARIVFACDAYDAMTADRPYRAGMRPDEALAELRRHAGTQFDPAVVDALCAEVALPGPPNEPKPDLRRRPRSGPWPGVIKLGSSRAT